MFFENYSAILEDFFIEYRGVVVRMTDEKSYSNMVFFIDLNDKCSGFDYDICILL